MDIEQAKYQAMRQVFFMTWGKIEDECRTRGIKVVSNRWDLEHKLVDAIAAEIAGDAPEQEGNDESAD